MEPRAHSLPSSARSPGGALSSAELEQRVAAAVPNAYLVEEHIVRRAVREERGIAGLRTFVPHTRCAAVTAEVFARVTTPEEVGRPLPEAGWALLIPRPDPADVSQADPQDVLREVWRGLFHAAIDARLWEQRRAGRLNRERVLEIVDTLGQLPMDEARTVLEEEGITGVGSDATRELIELTATWHELARFFPHHLERWFPSLVNRPEVQRLFDALVDAEALLASTRPDGITDPTRSPRDDDDDDTDDDATDSARPPNPARARSLVQSSREALAKGFDVTAAVLAHRARRGAPEEAGPAEADALTSLGRRLGRLDDETQAQPCSAPEDWATALAPLLPRARRGMARIEARLLHDLQKACATAERETWDIDLGRWLRSFGQASLRRRELVRAEVTVVRNLLRALRRVALCRLDEADRRRLTRLLSTLATRNERRFRQRVGALLADGLTAAALVPETLAERVAHAKLIAELLDKLLQRGFIAFPDLRDQIARNQLKLADLASPIEWLRGDALLALDRWCASHMDGAYRRAEGYRRWFQRLSSLLFANPLGRFVVRFGILPFGGSLFIVQGLEHMVGPLINLVNAPPPGEHPVYFWSLWSFAVVGAVLFALIHSRRVREAAGSALRGVVHGARFLFTELPRRIRAWQPIERLVRTRAFGLFWNRAFRPARYALIPTLIVVMSTGDPRLWLFVGLPLVVAMGFFLASRRGLRWSEAVGDWLVNSWHSLRNELLPGLFAWIMTTFKRLMELAEVALYTVEKWLRFRRGDGPLGVAFKTVFGFLWGIIAYLVRLVVTLVAEPQINPIKHFPVVTVSHKLTIPLTISIAYELRPVLGHAAADVFAGLMQFVIPGICGFLVWEFKENWRIYAANRKPNLHPVMVGPHGEPVYRLLRLGFHSGTIPRIFRKLRKAEKKQRAVEIRKHIEELHHIEEAMERFVERELKLLLDLSGRFPEAAHLHVEGVRLTPFRIAIDVGCPPLGAPLQLAFEEQSRFLVAGLARRGFVDTLDADRRDALETVLSGLYMLAGVDFVREHIEALLPGPRGETHYDIDDRGLVVWLKGYTSEVVYRLRSREPVLVPQQVTGDATTTPPAIPASDLFFKQRPMPWSTWIRLWEPDRREDARAERGGPVWATAAPPSPP